jgi:hypothetical protein
MGNTTSMKGPHMKGQPMKEQPEHQHGNVTCTMKHGRKHKQRRTAKHHGTKHHGKKHHGKKHRKYSGGFVVSPPNK